MWRDLSHSVSQALTIYSVALSRYDGAGIKAQALRTTAEQLHKIRLEIVADTSGSSRGKSITLLVASLRRSALGAVALQGEDTRAEDVSIDLPSVSGSEEGENDSFASLGEYDSDVSLSKSPALSKSRETLRATPRSPRSPTLNAPSAKNISKIIRSQNTPGSLAQTSLVAASQISSFFRRKARTRAAERTAKFNRASSLLRLSLRSILKLDDMEEGKDGAQEAESMEDWMSIPAIAAVPTTRKVKHPGLSSSSSEKVRSRVKSLHTLVMDLKTSKWSQENISVIEIKTPRGVWTDCNHDALALSTIRHDAQPMRIMT